jgi:HlyD family secretion protein
MDVGDTVEPGTILAQIDTADIDKQISIESEKLSALKYAFEDALNPNDREVIRQYESSYNSAVIARDSAKMTYEKNQKLSNEGAISTQTLDDSKNALDIAQENVNSQYQALLQVRKGLSEALKNKFAAEIKAQETALEILELQRDRHAITATQSGVVLNRNVEAGDYVVTGQITYEIADTGQIYFKSDILDSDVAYIHEGTSVVIYLNDDMHIIGHVVKVYPKAETQISDLGIEQKRVTVEIEASLDQTNILIGQELDIDYVVDSRENVLRVREDLTYQKDDMYYVFVLEAGRAVEKQLDSGLVGDTYIEILGGLLEGDTVIVPSDEIEPGSKVKLQE